MTLKFDGGEFPSFQVWVERMKRQNPAFKYRNHGQQRDRYYKERESFNRQQNSAEDCVSHSLEEREKVVEVMLNRLDISTIELAKITKLVVEGKDLTELRELAPLFKDPAHLNEAIEEYCEGIKSLIRAQLIAQVDFSITDSFRMVKDEPKITLFLDNLCSKSVRMAKGMIAEEIGSGACFGAESSSRDLVRKTKKWES